MIIIRIIIKTSMVIFLIILFGCDNSTGPEPGVSSISVRGDINESYDVTAYFGIATYSSDTTEIEYFTISLIPKPPGNNNFAITILYKFGPESPNVGTYNIGEYSFGEDIPAGDYGGSFSSKNATDLSEYIITSGELQIDESTTSKISGEFEMSGYYRIFFESDTTRIVTITGIFNAIPIQY